MRRMWSGLSCLASVLAVWGCATTEPNLKPPKQPEELRLPPDEKRYSQPPQFPDGTLNQNAPKAGNPMQPGSGGPGNIGASRPGGLTPTAR